MSNNSENTPGNCSCGTHTAPIGASSDGAIIKAVNRSNSFVGADRMTIASATLQKALNAMTPGEKREFLASALANGTAVVDKSVRDMETSHQEDVANVEDLWDGPPDDAIRLASVHGPGSSAPGGGGIKGPAQEASGGGASRMERMYSEAAMQQGVQEATERLGRELSKSFGRELGKYKTVIKSLRDLLTVYGERIALQEQALASTASADALVKSISAGLDTQIATAVANATPGILRQAVVILAKAAEKEDDKDSESGEEDEEEDEDEEADQAESGVGTKIETDNEVEEDDEAESDEGEEDGRRKKEAAKSRLVAKGLCKLVLKSVRKSNAEHDKGDMKDAKKHAKQAMKRLHKARLHFELSKSLRGAGFKNGPSSRGISHILKTASKGLKLQPMAQNQRKWAESPEPHITKGEVRQAAAGMTQTELEKALAGVGALQTNVNGLMAQMQTLARQPAGPDLMPLSMLAKAKPADLQAIEDQLNEMLVTDGIDMGTYDRAADVIAKSKCGFDMSSTVSILPDNVKALFTKAAA